MDPKAFVAHDAGSLVPTIESSLAFVPAPLPPRISFTNELVSALSEADRAIGELSALGRALGTHANPYLLINPFMRREAVLSSRIEGTEATVEDLFLFDVSPKRVQASDALEVRNYLTAHEHGLESSLPLCMRLIKELHQILMRGVRGHDKSPGRFRTKQNWIGTPTCKIGDARFVPPPPSAVTDCLSDLEKFANAPSDLPPLVRSALVHYQFETIHPFVDGNGRIGRIIISVMLCKEGLLPVPLLYLSAYFDRHKDEYTRRLYDVSTRGAWTEWLGFYLTGVSEQARDAVERAHRMFDLRQGWAERCQTARSSALMIKLVDQFFVTPILTVRMACDVLHVTPPAATKNLEKLVRLGILFEPEGTTRRMFVAREVLELAEADIQGR